MTAAPGDVEASFSRAAARYRDHAQIQRAMADWLAEWIPAARTGRALELGAGPGLFTERLLPWSGPLLATDLSAAMCAAGAARLPNLEWRRATAEHPPAGPWDFVFTSSMLQWLADPVAALSEIRAQLAPRGGRLLAGLFIAPTLPEWENLARIAPLPWRTAAQWLAALRAAGLHPIRSDTRTVAVEFPSAQSLLRSLHSAGAAPHRRLPPARLRRLLSDYDARHHTARGVTSTWTFFRFEATN